MSMQLAERRQFERTPVQWSGSLTSGESTDSCEVLCFSQTGAMIAGSNAVPLKGWVKLKVPDVGAFVGQVVWHRADRMGLNFTSGSDETQTNTENGVADESLFGLDPF